MEENNKVQRVTIEKRSRVTVNNVRDVDSFNECEVIFLTAEGMMTICGEDLHISRLDLEEGILIIDGTIDSVDYSDHEAERMSGNKKLFKVFR